MHDSEHYLIVSAEPPVLLSVSFSALGKILLVRKQLQKTSTVVFPSIHQCLLFQFSISNVASVNSFRFFKTMDLWLRSLTTVKWTVDRSTSISLPNLSMLHPCYSSFSTSNASTKLAVHFWPDLFQLLARSEGTSSGLLTSQNTLKIP